MPNLNETKFDISMDRDHRDQEGTDYDSTQQYDLSDHAKNKFVYDSFTLRGRGWYLFASFHCHIKLYSNATLASLGSKYASNK